MGGGFQNGSHCDENLLPSTGRMWQCRKNFPAPMARAASSNSGIFLFSNSENQICFGLWRVEFLSRPRSFIFANLVEMLWVFFGLFLLLRFLVFLISCCRGNLSFILLYFSSLKLIKSLVTGMSLLISWWRNVPSSFHIANSYYFCKYLYIVKEKRWRVGRTLDVHSSLGMQPVWVKERGSSPGRWRLLI